MFLFAYYASMYYPICTCDCSIFSHNIPLNEVLSQSTSRTLWKYIDTFWPALSYSSSYSMFPYSYQSSTPYKRSSLTSMLAKSIWVHSLQYIHSTVQDFADASFKWLAHIRMKYQPACHLGCQWDYRSHQWSHANFRYQKYSLVHSRHDFQLEGSGSFGFRGYLILVFILQGGHLGTYWGANVIFLTV
jgi:hypothetical protein